MSQIKSFCQLFILIISMSCASKREANLIKEFEALKPSDFSYIIQPVFTQDKALLEKNIQESFSADEVVVGVSGVSGVIGSPTEKEDSDCWLQCIIVNSAIISEKNDSLTTVKGREAAQLVLEGISNDEAYQKIKITFMRRVQQGSVWMKSNTHKWYSIPSLESKKF